MRQRVMQLNRITSVGEQMFELNMKLRQLYIDALDAIDDGSSREVVDDLRNQISVTREELDQLEILYATMRTELDTR
jgi:hypothetical protein